MNMTSTKDLANQEFQSIENALKLQELLEAQANHNEHMRKLEEENKLLREKCEDMNESKE